MNGLYATLERYRPYILSILRIVVGLLFLENGLSKVFDFPPPSPAGALSGLLFFAFFAPLFSAYVSPSLVKSGLLTATTTGLFGTAGVASFIAALFTGLFIGTILCGFLADRFGRRAIFPWSLLWYSAANVMVALQHDAAGINFLRLICGIGLGVEMVTIGAYLSELAPKGLRGRAFAINQAIGFVAVPVVSFLAFVIVRLSPFGVGR